MKRVHRTGSSTRAAGVAALLLLGPLWATAALAQAEGDLGLGPTTEAQATYSVTAGARGISLVYNRENLLPVNPLFSLGMPQVGAQLDNSPVSFARAAPFDPGVLAAGRAFAQIFGAPADLVPPYPAYADSGYPTGARSSTVNGGHTFLAGRSSADAESARATAVLGEGEGGESHAQGLRLPATKAMAERITLLRETLEPLLAPYRQAGAPLGGSPSLAEEPAPPAPGDPPGGPPDGPYLSVKGGKASVELRHQGANLFQVATSEMQDVDLFGGIIHIDSILSRIDLKLSGSEPANPVLTTSLSGVSIMGVPTTLTKEGFTFQEQNFAVPPDVVKSLNEAFTANGGGFRVDDRRVESGSVSVTAFALSFAKSVQPGETDVAELSLGTTNLRYFWEVVQTSSSPGPDLGLGTAEPTGSESASGPGFAEFAAADNAPLIGEPAAGVPAGAFTDVSLGLGQTDGGANFAPEIGAIGATDAPSTAGDGVGTNNQESAQTAGSLATGALAGSVAPPPDLTPIMNAVWLGAAGLGSLLLGGWAVVTQRRRT